MIRITCYVRPHRLEVVKSAIAVLGVSGMTVSDVRGAGNSPETSDLFGGDPNLVALPIRAKIEVVVPEDLQEDVVNAILDTARTGEAGDGKIFIEPIADALRIRTGERGQSAI
jgi:nitrogen regulatory protein P-II 1